MNAGILLLVHAAATWFMAGLIWLVQIVHYPLLARVGAAGFRDHQSLITLIVGPAMLIELAAAVLLLFQRRDAWTLAGVALLAVIWISTALIQIPLHHALSTGFDAEGHTRLVQTNWIRTIAWTARGLLALYLIRATSRFQN